MLLAIDVGNTHIVLGVFEDDRIVVNWRLATRRDSTEDELGMVIINLLNNNQLRLDDIDAVAISSVVPQLMYSLERMAKKYFNVVPLVIGPGIKTGLNILMDNPREVGADRIVNAVAGYSLYGGPLIIVDFGTATTFCAISEEGEYLGGAIAPGIGISMEALFEKAAKLPRVELIRPANVIGKNTIASMQSGVVYGFVGQVDGIVRRIMEEFATTPTVVATGGFATLIARESETLSKVNPLLTLEGLRIIVGLNR
ncbi:MAG TPA: type III pantothenate kinase [Candidatus Limnocylindrales bacterium]|nr:type III pantothenate kinase [Candidatus Limnocylindrales bacterium]